MTHAIHRCLLPLPLPRWCRRRVHVLAQARGAPAETASAWCTRRAACGLLVQPTEAECYAPMMIWLMGCTAQQAVTAFLPERPAPAPAGHAWCAVAEGSGTRVVCNFNDQQANTHAAGTRQTQTRQRHAR